MEIKLNTKLAENIIERHIRKNLPTDVEDIKFNWDNYDDTYNSSIKIKFDDHLIEVDGDFIDYIIGSTFNLSEEKIDDLEVKIK